MDFHFFVLASSGVLANWLIACTLLIVLDRVKAGDVSGSWLKFGLRKTYWRLVDANNAFADQPYDLKHAAKRLVHWMTYFLRFNMVACVCMLALTVGWFFQNAGHIANFGPAGLIGSRVMIGCDYVLIAFSILLLGDWQSLNMRAGKRLKMLRVLVNLVSSINEYAIFENYHQPLRQTLVKIADLPEPSFQSFGRQFNEHDELWGRLTVLQHALQQDNLAQLLKENADLANEVNQTIQALLDTMTSCLNCANDVRQSAAEQSRKLQSQRLLNEFKAVTALRK